MPGELTLRGVSQPLTLKAVRFNCYRNPLFNREVCGGDFEATVRRNEVLLRVQVEAVRQPD